jgi:hypothetical protein
MFLYFSCIYFHYFLSKTCAIFKTKGVNSTRIYCNDQVSYQKLTCITVNKCIIEKRLIHMHISLKYILSYHTSVCFVNFSITINIFPLTSLGNFPSISSERSIWIYFLIMPWVIRYAFYGVGFFYLVSQHDIDIDFDQTPFPRSVCFYW